MRTSHASVPPFLPAALSCDACRYLISNCKDQSIKLWDLRHCLVSDRQAREFAERPDIPSFRWDYRSVTSYPCGEARVQAGRGRDACDDVSDVR